MSDSGESTHEASPLRVQQARSEGDIPKSYELAATIAMVGALAAAYFLLFDVGDWLLRWTEANWHRDASTIKADPDVLMGRAQSLIYSLVVSILPFMLVIALAAVASHWIQTGPIWLPKLANPSLTNLGPRRWLNQLAPGKIFGSTLLGLPKIAIGFSIMLIGLWWNRVALIGLGLEPVAQMLVHLFSIVIQITFMVVIGMSFLSGLDYFFHWLSYRRRLRMTDQEVRDEASQQEGDNVSRSRQRRLDRV
ncbi:MAG: EscU/YscU/HrcU family type III secretion system export apparatus switch protein [Planctomycetota bacterium]